VSTAVLEQTYKPVSRLGSNVVHLMNAAAPERDAHILNAPAKIIDVRRGFAVLAACFARLQGTVVVMHPDTPVTCARCNRIGGQL
jgi:hypothetical protein